VTFTSETWKPPPVKRPHPVDSAGFVVKPAVAVSQGFVSGFGLNVVPLDADGVRLGAVGVREPNPDGPEQAATNASAAERVPATRQHRIVRGLIVSFSLGVGVRLRAA
jgi:hypothetical protein